MNSNLKTNSRHLAAGLLILLGAACSGDPQTSASQTDSAVPEAARIVAGLEPQIPVAGDPGWSLEERMRRHRVPGLSLAVFDDYKIVWTAAFGMADVAAQVPVTTATLFQAGSISKSVAATAVLAAAQRGELDLDAPVNSLLTSWKLPDNEHTAQAPVTPRRLLSHSAGTTVHGFPGYAVDEEIPSLQQVLDGAFPANTSPVRVDTVPGTIYRYSGGGITIMQLAMTDLTGLSYPELLRREVLDPMGMTRSTFEQPLPPDWLERAAAGYQSDGRAVWGMRHTYPEMAAAGLWTTATDLARFALDLQRSLRGEGDGLLRVETVEEMVLPVLAQAGLGLFQIESNETLYFGHNGADAGFQALLIASREGGHGVAMMLNSDNGIRLAMEVLPAIARAFEWPGFAVEPLQPAAVEVQALEGLVGLYQVRDHVVLEVTRRGDQLLGRVLLDSEGTRLVPLEDGSFVAQDDGATLRFELGADGRARGYVNANDPESALRPRIDDSETPYLGLFDADRTAEAIAYLAEGEVSESYLNQLGYSLLAYNHAEQALAVFSLTIERHPSSANAYDSLGDALLALDRTAEAAEASRQVLALLANDPELPEEAKLQYALRAEAQIRRFGAAP